MTFSLGELLIRRKLEKWPATSNYKPGQEHATMIGGETALISWVDDAGAACIVFCTFIADDEEWKTHTQIIRAGNDWIELRPIPRAFALGDKWARLISKAKKERRTSSGSKKKSDAPDEAEESSSPA